jgi:transcriptional regulator with XRE-family HTH domain
MDFYGFYWDFLMNRTDLPIENAHRIRVERKRLGKSQDEIAALCGSSREMWGRYERGTHVMPGNVLNAFVDSGANLSFLRTGVTSKVGNASELTSNFTPSEAMAVLRDYVKSHSHETGSIYLELSEKEHELVISYRDASPERREIVHDLLLTKKLRASL